jgi:hypothetical protein
MATYRFPTRPRLTSRSLDLKQSILASFVLDQEQARPRLVGFNEVDWLSILWWLDISGIAIYFLDRVQQIGIEGILPQAVHSSLAQRLENNRSRTQALFDEACALSASFDADGIPYALLKGITLVPHSVPDSALRAQTDLDFLVPARLAERASRHIHLRGYTLYAISGNTLEYRAGSPSIPDLANIYSVHTQRALELHLAPEGLPESQLLERRVELCHAPARIYSLSPEDILVRQALHLLKHLCGEHTRISWVLEFRRHILTRCDAPSFFQRAASCAANSFNGSLAMAVAIWSACELFSDSGVNLPEEWRESAIPPHIKLWLERYLRNLLLSDEIGSKLYALLQTQVPSAPSTVRSTSQILLPRTLPAPIFRSRPGERLTERCSRYAIELSFFQRRLRFHIREGIRFIIEATRWNRAIAKEGR